MKRHIGYTLKYWRKFDIKNKHVLSFSIDTYNELLKEFGSIDAYLKTMISEKFDWLCLPKIK